MYRWVFFDIETTGTFPTRDRIVEIGAFDLQQNASFSSLCNPQITIPKEVISIHKITNEMVASEPTFAQMIDSFFSFTEGNVALVAHNGLAFDFAFLQAELQRCGREIPKNWLLIDSLLWARKYRKDLPRHALQYLRQFFLIEPNNAHRALDDAITLSRVFRHMIGDLTPEQVAMRIPIKLSDAPAPVSPKAQTEQLLVFE